MDAWLTPESFESEGVPSRFLLEVEGHLFHYVYGALAELTDVSNWEQFGVKTPDETADYWQNWLFDLRPMSNIYAWTILNADQSAAHNTDVALVWSSTIYKGITQATGAQLEVPEDGMYSVSTVVVFAANTTGFRRVQLVKNGVIIVSAQVAPASTGLSAVPINFSMPVVAGDKLEVLARQGSGGALDIQAAPFVAFRTRLAIWRLGDYP